MRRNLLTPLTTLFLIVATLAVYRQVGNHEFINFDDNLYVTENFHVQAGLTLLPCIPLMWNPLHGW